MKRSDPECVTLAHALPSPIAPISSCSRRIFVRVTCRGDLFRAHSSSAFSLPLGLFQNDRINVTFSLSPVKHNTTLYICPLYFFFDNQLLRRVSPFVLLNSYLSLNVIYLNVTIYNTYLAFFVFLYHSDRINILDRSFRNNKIARSLFLLEERRREEFLPTVFMSPLSLSSHLSG